MLILFAFTCLAYPCAAAVPDSGTELTMSASTGDSIANTRPHCIRTEYTICPIIQTNDLTSYVQRAILFYSYLRTLKNAITSSEIDVFEDTKCLRFFIWSFHYLDSFNSLSSQLYNFARKYFANISRANTQESARFRWNYPAFCFIIIIVRLGTCYDSFYYLVLVLNIKTSLK